jgi:polyisoprenoid-binding protein YceI
MTSAARSQYVIDTKVSQFTIQAFSGGMLSAFGHDPKFIARDFDGEMTFDPDSPNEASLTMRMPAASLELMDHVSERDREAILRTMHVEVLESATFPEIVYRCQKASPRAVGPGQFEVLLDGELTLHGVTRDQPIAGKLSATGPVLRALGEFTVRQTDYDIKLVTVAGSMLKVKDELKCSFDIVARRSAGSGG